MTTSTNEEIKQATEGATKDKQEMETPTPDSGATSSESIDEALSDEKEASDDSSNPAPQQETSDEQSALNELQAKYDQLNDNFLRTLAEFENYRKRSLNEKAELIKNGGKRVLESILPVVDDFERGLKVLEKTDDMAAIKEGMTLVYNKLQSFLKQNGVSVIDTENQAFDTDLHEAITMCPAPDESLKGKVMDCVQKGYYLNDKVLRYAKVVVGN